MSYNISINIRIIKNDNIHNVVFISILFFLIVITTTSCTYFINNDQKELRKIKIKDPINNNNICGPGYNFINKFNNENVVTKNNQNRIKHSDIYFGNNNSINPSDWEEFIQILTSKKIKLSFIDKTILWSLLQMNIRPDLSSPTTNLQLLINDNGNGVYWEFSVNESSKVLYMLLSENDNDLKKEDLLDEKDEISLLVEDIEKRLTDNPDRKSRIKSKQLTQLQSDQEENKKTNYNNKKKETMLFFPYLFGLETIADYYKSNHSLLELAGFLDKYYNFSIVVNEDFAKFLEFISTTLRSNADFKKNYFHEDEILRYKEQIPKINFTRVINGYLKNNPKALAKSIYKISNALLNVNYLNEQSRSNDNSGSILQITSNNNKNYQKDVKILCNKDINKYSQFLFNINDQQIKGNLFGHFSDDHTKSTLAFSNQKISYPFPIFNTPLFGTLNIDLSNANSKMDNNDKNTFATLCFIQNFSTTNKYNLSLISIDDRDPSQHIYHLLRYDFKNIYSLEGIRQMLKNARYIVLKNPLRLVFESKRTTKEQMEKIMTMDVPVYHSPALGNIWGIGHIENSVSGIIIDDRNIEHSFCFHTNNGD